LAQCELVKQILIEMDKFEQHIKRMKGLRDVYEAGTGQHNILSMLIAECEIALSQPPVIGSVCVHSFVPAGHSWGTDWESCIKCGYKREQTDR
jgi:hypothetical protein